MCIIALIIRFRKLEALQYHYEDHRKKTADDQDMEVDNEPGKKPKTDKSKVDSSGNKSKQNGKNASGKEASDDAAKDGKEDSESKPKEEKTMGDTMSVAQSLLELSKPQLEKETGPPSLTLPPRIEKEKAGQTPSTAGQTSMPTLIQGFHPKPAAQSASALPPMPILTPKPGLLQSAPSPGPKRMTQGSPVPDAGPGKTSPCQTAPNTAQAADAVPSPVLGTTSSEQPPKLERRPTSPFQPVKPDPGSPNAAQQNARCALAWTNILCR